MRNYKGHLKYCLQDSCKKEFLGMKNQLYCSIQCRNKDYGITAEFKNLPTATVGAIQEYRVAIELLSKGYEVFRATSPSCSCDLLVLEDGKPKKIEVTTAYKSHSGKLLHCKKKSSKYDILACVLHNGEIIFFPSLQTKEPQKGEL